MTKEKLLHTIATNGYNVGFGAKKNFASHDIVVKLPSWIAYATLAIGILQLGYESLGSNKELSTILILVSVACLYIGFYNSQVEKFEQEGIRLTKIFNELRILYYRVQSSSKQDFLEEEEALNKIITEFYSNSISKQVFLSQWYAHFKFFYEMQIDWVDEQLKFTFFKDKFPNSLKLFLISLLLFALIFVYYEYFRNV